MGLDIYVRWGAIGEDGDDVDFPEDIRQDQCTGFENAPECGYLRHNWTSVRRMREFASEYSAPNPITDMSPVWNGHNGETLQVDADVLAHLITLRRKVLDYLSHKPYEMRNVKMDKVDTVAERQEIADDFDYFRKCLRNLVGFINFVELHKDEDNLRIYFG